MKFLSDGVDRLRFHFAQGHRIFLVTGAPATLAELVASYLPVPLTIVGTRLEARDGLWTGEITGGHMCGEAKQRAIVHLAAKHSLDLARSFAYGDRIFDLPMLETVGHPTAVNPSKNLERSARDRNWPVLHWRGRWRGHGREAQNPRAGDSRDTLRAWRGLHASLMPSMNFRRTHP